MIIDTNAKNLKATLNLFDGADNLVASPLPRVDGRGLTVSEFARLNGAANRARAAYEADCPDADIAEGFRIGRLAAVDELRRLLKDRAPAPCCDENEAVPCVGCALNLPARIVAVDEDPGDIESDPAEWPDWCDHDVWNPIDPEEEEPRLTLAGFIESEATVMRARGLDVFDLMADHLSDLARIVRNVDAVHPNQVWVRVDALDRDYTEHAMAWEPEMNSAGVWS